MAELQVICEHGSKRTLQSRLHALSSKAKKQKLSEEEAAELIRISLREIGVHFQATSAYSCQNVTNAESDCHCHCQPYIFEQNSARILRQPASGDTDQ